MRLTRTGKTMLMLAALLLGIGPVHALVIDICKSDPATAIAMDVKGIGCDCEASGCQNGAPVFCGQCLVAVSAATSGLELPRRADRRTLTVVHDSWLGSTRAPPVPPPERTT